MRILNKRGEDKCSVDGTRRDTAISCQRKPIGIYVDITGLKDYLYCGQHSNDGPIVRGQFAEDARRYGDVIFNLKTIREDS